MEGSLRTLSNRAGEALSVTGAPRRLETTDGKDF